MKILDHFAQGSDEWLSQRLGKITMSHAKELLTGGKGKTRQSYILDVVAESLSGVPTDSPDTPDMQRGTYLEPWAKKAFTAHTGVDIREVGFVLADDERIGCSPDALLSDHSGLEIKCPKPRQHLRNITGDGIKDYIAQIQGSMWVTSRQSWLFVSFCPWVSERPFHLELVARDDEMIERLAASAIDAADEVQRLREEILSAPPKRVVSKIAAQAAHEWDSMWQENDEVQL